MAKIDRQNTETLCVALLLWKNLWTRCWPARQGSLRVWEYRRHRGSPIPLEAHLLAAAFRRPLLAVVSPQLLPHLAVRKELCQVPGIKRTTNRLDGASFADLTRVTCSQDRHSARPSANIAHRALHPRFYITFTPLPTCRRPITCHILLCPTFLRHKVWDLEATRPLKD